MRNRHAGGLAPREACSSRLRPAAPARGLRRDPHVEPDPGGPDVPVVAVPADDDAGGLEAVEHLLDVGGDAVLVLGDEVELAADEVQDAADGRGPLLDDPALALGRGGFGALEGQLERAQEHAELAEPGLAEAE